MQCVAINWKIFYFYCTAAVQWDSAAIRLNKALVWRIARVGKIQFAESKFSEIAEGGNDKIGTIISPHIHRGQLLKKINVFY